MDYGKRRAIHAIRKLPAGTYSYQVRHDPVKGVCDAGVPITAKVTVDSKKGLITVDVRDNPDCLPGGLNLTEACSLHPVWIGVYYNLDASVPHNHGSASRIVPLLRDNCVVGRPKSSDRHLLRDQQMRTSGPPMRSSAVSRKWVSPTEWRKAAAISRQPWAWSRASIRGRASRDVPYITQLMLALSGGPANPTGMMAGLPMNAPSATGSWSPIRSRSTRPPIRS